MAKLHVVRVVHHRLRAHRDREGHRISRAALVVVRISRGHRNGRRLSSVGRVRQRQGADALSCGLRAGFRQAADIRVVVLPLVGHRPVCNRRAEGHRLDGRVVAHLLVRRSVHHHCRVHRDVEVHRLARAGLAAGTRVGRRHSNFRNLGRRRGVGQDNIGDVAAGTGRTRHVSRVVARPGIAHRAVLDARLEGHIECVAAAQHLRGGRGHHHLRIHRDGKGRGLYGHTRRTAVGVGRRNINGGGLCRCGAVLQCSCADVSFTTQVKTGNIFVVACPIVGH